MTFAGFLAFLDYHSLGLLATVCISVAAAWIIAEENGL